MSKLDELVILLSDPACQGHSNAAIAKLARCDEGMVRRARHKAEIAALQRQVAELRAELAACRRASLPPRRAARPGPYYPLLETLVDDQPVPIVAMIGDPA